MTTAGATFTILLIAGVITFLIINKVDHPASNAYVVIVTHDGVQQTVPSNEPTVGALLTRLHITLHKGDVVQPSPVTRINNNDFRINIYRATPVEIVEGSTRTNTFSAAGTPRAIAQQAGFTLYPEDSVTESIDSNYVNGAAIGKIINIEQSLPITLILYGTPIETRALPGTVADMLAAKHIVLKNGATVQPSLTTAITPNMQVLVLQKGTHVVTTTQTIAEPVQTINDPSLSEGTSAIQQQGSPGILLEVNTQTGARTQLQSVEVQPPVTEIELVGTAPVNSSLQSWLLALRTCESGDNYQEDTGNGYYGAYQFSLGTWERLGLSGLPSQASPSVQDQAIINNTNDSSGGLASQNPGCYYKTGISAFPP
jgi:uncharacterized protein YabE (DUF348 family)